ncbi:hypothetical protein BC941DRAFT_518371 [Chlamydoabsidia padenii]|nr:hypothetical protein BC941DRAFT_518371 [Chlamydoabsidia padenii]
MKFSATCISFAITLLAASSIQAAPVLGSNGKGLAQVNSDQIEVPAAKLVVNSQQIKVGGLSTDDTGADKVVSDATSGVVGEKTVLRKRGSVVDGQITGNGITGFQGEKDPVAALTGLRKRGDVIGGPISGNGVTGVQGDSDLVGDLTGLRKRGDVIGGPISGNGVTGVQGDSDLVGDLTGLRKRGDVIGGPISGNGVTGVQGDSDLVGDLTGLRKRGDVIGGPISDNHITAVQGRHGESDLVADVTDGTLRKRSSTVGNLFESSSGTQSGSDLTGVVQQTVGAVLNKRAPVSEDDTSNTEAPGASD